MFNKIITLFVCFVLFSPFIFFESEKTTYRHQNIEQENSVINRVIPMLMRIGRFPSLSTVVINDEQVVWSEGFGFTDLDVKKPATDQTIYMVCSISKTITGTALMQLYEQGLFELDDDVNDYLPFSLRNPNFPNDTITFRMILSHSSSLRSDPESFYWLNYSAYPPIPWYPHPWIEHYIVPGGPYYVEDIWHQSNRPGDRAQYSNANFVLTAYLVEILSNESFIDYCETNIFAPLDMEKASFNLADFDIEDVAIPYHFYMGEYRKITELDWGANPPGEDYYRMLHYPVGGLYTSVVDLSHFLIAHMNGGVYNGTRIINESTLQEMHSNQPPLMGYGLAWYFSGTLYGQVFSGHEGDIPGYHNCMFMRHPDFNHGIIFFITGDRYTPIGRTMALFIRNILFFKARLLSSSNILDIPEHQKIITNQRNFNIPNPLIEFQKLKLI
jgi:CubicO group peptidase (beta-lactamase class C family)